MTPQEKLINYAQSWVGKLNETNGDNNVAIMHEEIDEVVCGFSMSGRPWCQFFVVYCMCKCFTNETAAAMMYQRVGSVSCGCDATATIYKNAGAFYTSPEVGDQMFIYYGGEINHVGIVVEIDGNTIYTVEGNYSDGCNLVKHFRGESAIAGYGRSKWALAGEQTSTIVAEPVKTSEVKLTGGAAAAFQGWAIFNGYDPGRYKDRRGVASGVDGDAGTLTTEAMRRALADGKITEAKLKTLQEVFA